MTLHVFRFLLAVGIELRYNTDQRHNRSPARNNANHKKMRGELGGKEGGRRDWINSSFLRGGVL